MFRSICPDGVNGMDEMGTIAFGITSLGRIASKLDNNSSGVNDISYWFRKASFSIANTTE